MVALRRILRRVNLDVVGFSASAVCAIHCMVVPLLLVVGIFQPAHLIHDHQVENAILLVSGVLGTSSFVPSMLFTHRRRMPFTLFLLGIVAIVAGRFPVPLVWEATLTTGGAALIAYAHYRNWKLCRACSLHAVKK